jgi:hypothetical protein
MKFVHAVSQHLYKKQGSDTGFYHWCDKEITLEAELAQDVWIVSERGGQTPFTLTAIPQVLEIVVPYKTEMPGCFRCPYSILLC